MLCLVDHRVIYKSSHYISTWRCKIFRCVVREQKLFLPRNLPTFEEWNSFISAVPNLSCMADRLGGGKDGSMQATGAQMELCVRVPAACVSGAAHMVIRCLHSPVLVVGHGLGIGDP